MTENELFFAAKEAVKTLENHKKTLALAESCTGGLVSKLITDVSGASAVYEGGVCSYSNSVKMKILGVKEETLKAYGAVSEQTAYEMALGAAKAADAKVSLAVTGIAGPGGGTKEKPVGLVYIGCCIDGKVNVLRNLFQGDRLSVRKQATARALALLLECLKNEKQV